MLRGLFALLFVCALAQAETVNNFTYVEAGYSETKISYGWGSTIKIHGSTLAASWQFQPQWFLAYASLFDAEARDTDYTHDIIKVSMQSLKLGYVMHSTSKTDWIARVGRIHTEYPSDPVFVPDTFDYYRDEVNEESTTVTFGARHRYSRWFELSWEAGPLLNDDVDFHGSVNPRWLVNDSFSLGFQLASYDAFGTVELNARLQF